MDQIAPEFVALNRINTRRRLVENQYFRAVDDRDGELEPLTNTERETVGPAVNEPLKIEPLQHLPDACLDAVRREPEQMRVEIEVLADSEFAIKRE